LVGKEGRTWGGGTGLERKNRERVIVIPHEVDSMHMPEAEKGGNSAISTIMKRGRRGRKGKDCKVTQSQADGVPGEPLALRRKPIEMEVIDAARSSKQFLASKKPS